MERKNYVNGHSKLSELIEAKRSRLEKAMVKHDVENDPQQEALRMEMKYIEDLETEYGQNKGCGDMSFLECKRNGLIKERGNKKFMSEDWKILNLKVDILEGLLENYWH